MKPELEHTNKLSPFHLLSTFPDEAPSSWLIRLANANYLDLREFCKMYGLSEVLKSDIDISPKIPSQIFSNSKVALPSGIVKTIPDFQWKRSGSDWLIRPNKIGFARWNTFSRICPLCIAEFGYFRNSWKLKLFTGCSRCNIELIESCPTCLKTPSIIRSDLNKCLVKNYNPLHYCWYCESDYRMITSKILDSHEKELIKKIEKAYLEDPPNIRYLKFLQFGFIEELRPQKSS